MMRAVDGPEPLEPGRLGKPCVLVLSDKQRNKVQSLQSGEITFIVQSGEITFIVQCVYQNCLIFVIHSLLQARRQFCRPPEIIVNYVT